MEAFRLALVFLLAMGFFYRGETNSQYDDKKMWDFLKTKSNTNNFFREILNEMVALRNLVSMWDTVVKQRTTLVSAITSSDDKAASTVPGSCADLYRLGHRINQIYTVVRKPGIALKVFCDFTKKNTEEGLEFLIGPSTESTDLDYETPRRIHFEVRSEGIVNVVGPIKFSIDQWHSSGIDLDRGTFIAPATGVYFFSFITNAEEKNTTVALFTNKGLDQLATAQSLREQQILTLITLAQLTQGQDVQIHLLSGVIRPNKSNKTTFIGIMIA